MRFLISFSYDGSNFSGYQKQPRKRTVQKELETALKEINSKKKVDVVASGRTDSGVHAYNQRAHFDLNISISPEKLKIALNSLLPNDIFINDVECVDDHFHARFNVKAKEYVYKINMGKFNPFERNYVFQYCKKLNIEEMRKALKYFEGTHDFRSFVKIDELKPNYTRTIIKTSIDIQSQDENVIAISIYGTGFMRYMVRNIVGMLIEIGEGKYKSEDIVSILEMKDRKKAGICAPACGLYLKDVYY